MHRWSLPEVREEGCGGGDRSLPNTGWPVVGILPQNHIRKPGKGLFPRDWAQRRTARELRSPAWEATPTV